MRLLQPQDQSLHVKRRTLFQVKHPVGVWFGVWFPVVRNLPSYQW
jgi:hypothetical protein